MAIETTDPNQDAKAENISENLRLWDDRAEWEGRLKYGYRWWGTDGLAHFLVRQRVIETCLMPYVRDRLPLDILEIGPGGGRVTAELIPLAKSLAVIDVSKAAIDLCKERFKYYDHLSYFVNDGESLDMVADDAYDLVVSWDVFVHVAPDIASCYLEQIAAKLRWGGTAIIHHSARRNQKGDGWRSDLSTELMKEIATKHGLIVKAQIGDSLRKTDGVVYYRDCCSVMEKLNPEFVPERPHQS